MEATKQGIVGGRRLRMAGDLLWFAGVSMVAGLLAAIAMAAVAMLLAQPARAADGRDALERAPIEVCDPDRFADAPMLPDECSHPLVLILGREEALDRLGLGCEDGLDPTEYGFYRLIDRERREIENTLRRS